MAETIVRIPHDEPDWFLQSLVSMVDLGKFDFGITLQVGGFLVSGNLINGAEYFKGFASEFSSGFQDPETVKFSREMFEQNAKLYEQDEKASDEKGEESIKPLPTFIHLKNTRFFTTGGAPIPENRGVWWRGRISEVSGFILGSLGPPK